MAPPALETRRAAYVVKVIGARLINNERESGRGGREGGTERAFVGVKSVMAAPAAMPSVGSGTAPACVLGSAAADTTDGRTDGRTGGMAAPAASPTC